ncbi:MAG: NAD-binding protein [Dehalococcoidia bacterium]
MRAARCGYDGLEVHCARSYLLGEFLSPFANKRTDEYGGSLENRTRIVREIIQRLRERVGDTIIGIRIIGDERVEDGLSNPEVVEICQVLEREGIDYVGMSMGHGPNAEMIFPPMAFERGPFVDVAAALKKAVNVPFYATHRIRDVTLAEEMVAKGQADIVSLTRPSLADPEIANKAREGRADDIRPCIACLEGCYARVRLGLPITCLANPAAGREAEFRITTADIGRKVAVVGGGPAGLEAARVLASRGHRVDLYERTGELGGQMRWAAALPVRGEMFDVVRWQIGQVKKLGVQILLNTEATIATLKAGGYEAVVVATGGAYVREAPAWAAGVPTITVPEAFDLTLPAGATVVVLDRDGHSKPMGFAERFADAGHQTVLMTEAADFGVDWDDLNVKLTMQRLRDKGVRFVSKMQDPRFDGSTLHVRHEGWPVRIADVATIVLADRPVAHDGLARQIDDEWPEIEPARRGRRRGAAPRDGRHLRRLSRRPRGGNAARVRRRPPLT